MSLGFFDAFEGVAASCRTRFLGGETVSGVGSRSVVWTCESSCAGRELVASFDSTPLTGIADRAASLSARRNLAASLFRLCLPDFPDADGLSACPSESAPDVVSVVVARKGLGRAGLYRSAN